MEALEHLVESTPDDTVFAMHLAESSEELELLRSASGPFAELLKELGVWTPDAFEPGRRPLDYLRLLSRAPRALVVHGNYLDDEELCYLAEHRARMALVYCPRTHAYFGHAPYPLAKALELGARVALGTDSRASNPDLDLLAEMRLVAQTHPDIPLPDVLRLGTQAGAEALGRELIGTLREGNLANLVAVELPARDDDPHELLLRAAGRARQTWYRGAPCQSE
jgi:cytosine/adenosine deaminase-related metal-dependent hydrolase